jgi:uncharacterized protein (DUF362 family)
VSTLLKQFNLQDYSGKYVALKANYNSADPFPASTHIDTISAIVENLKAADAGQTHWWNAVVWGTPAKYWNK